MRNWQEFDLLTLINSKSYGNTFGSGMKIHKQLGKRKERRTFRVRNQVRRVRSDRPRLSVFRSKKHIYAQIIDDAAGNTLAAASTRETAICGPSAGGSNKEAAAKVGTALAERAKKKGISEVRFDRGAAKYHGRVAALADAARKGGLEF